MNNEVRISPAEEASEKALIEVFARLEGGHSFLLEAGAGAGKTWSLVKALHFLIGQKGVKLSKRYQKVACITFTNVAKDEIEARTDRNPLIYCDTTHAFCWSLISGFQKQLRQILPQLEQWPDRIAEAGGVGGRAIEYALGFRSIKSDRISIHHDDVLPLTIELMGSLKFRRLVADRYPIILIDEYQDTDAAWIEAIKKYYLGYPGSPQLGFFGDHWQKIYDGGCGRIEHSDLTSIGKKANFRSVPAIVDCLNRMRPQLPQSVQDPDATGSVHVFHTNSWTGTRQTGSHWKGDLPEDVAHAALEVVLDRLAQRDWDMSSAKTKILMLTHRGLASEQGYSKLLGVFRYNNAVTKKEHDHIAFFVDKLEPACTSFTNRRYGEMFAILGGHVPPIRSQDDKKKWAVAMKTLIDLRMNGTVGQVLAHLRKERRPRLPESIEQDERELERFDKDTDEGMPWKLQELEKFHEVPYQEVIALTRYLNGHSPFETKHGVKGAQFDNVVVVVGRGWSKYNFNKMLELAHDAECCEQSFERNRNLFYVTCSRPKKRLAVLFTQELSALAMQTVESWFGAEVVEDIGDLTSSGTR